MASIVVAFGGNAIHPSGTAGTLEAQRENIHAMAEQLGRLVVSGHRVVVTHGNGPQVGEIMLRSEIARDTVPPLALDVGGASSQGQIGYMLQQEIGNVLTTLGAPGTVCTVITQVIVDAHDPAFARPTKPIGRFYPASEVESLTRDREWSMVEDAGRGYRRVVPSPTPLAIVEWAAVKALTDAGVLVIAAGGGGVPVVQGADGTLHGMEAVIDKDLASQRLGSLIGADTLVLLTGVDRVSVDYGTPEERPLTQVSLSEVRDLNAQGHFPAGSMGPKVQAAIQFLESGGRRVIITSPHNLSAALDDPEVGTQMTAGTTGAQQQPAAAAGQTR